VAEILAALCVTVVAVCIAHQLFLRSEDFGAVESIGGISVMLLLLVVTQDGPEAYAYACSIVFTFILHALYILVTKSGHPNV